MFTKSKRSFVEGPMFWRITAFAVPLMLTGILQILYNMADNIVVGQFSGDPYALGAVGCTSSLINLVVNLLLGMSAGAGVVVAQGYGAKNDSLVSRTVHTSLTFALIGGFVFMGIGLLVSSPMLRVLGTREVFFDRAVLYMRIICLGIPASAVYNYGASVLRSVGNSKTPLFILGASGLLNVILNLVFVMGFGMSVAGVAIATIASQYASAVAVMSVLIKNKDESYGFSLKKYCFDKTVLARILRLGVPAGVQSAMFSISNMILLSSINTLTDVSVTANTIANSVDSIAYTCGNSFCVACTTFTGQNYGAAKPDRVKKALIYSLIQGFAVVFIIGRIGSLLATPLAALFVDSTNPAKDAIIAEAVTIIKFLLSCYFLCAVMEVFSGFLRALGYSLLPMINSIFGICIVRIIWAFTFFPMERFNSFKGLMICYPLSWGIAALLQLSCILLFARKKLNAIKAIQASKEKVAV